MRYYHGNKGYWSVWLGFPYRWANLIPCSVHTSNLYDLDAWIRITGNIVQKSLSIRLLDLEMD